MRATAIPRSSNNAPFGTIRAFDSALDLSPRYRDETILGPSHV